MRLTPAIAFLALLLITPAVVQAAVPRDQTQTYVVGGSGTYVTYENPGQQVTVGSMWFDVPEAWADAVDVTIRDMHGTPVHAIYSWHNEDHSRDGLFGPPVSALETGTLCQSATLDIPEEATRLRVVVNPPDTLTDPSCLPGRATAGTVSVHFT